MGTELVSLGVSEFPDFLLDDPLDLLTESVDLGLPSESGLVNSSDNSFLSFKKLSGFVFSESIHAGIGSSLLGIELGLKFKSDGIDSCLNVILAFLDLGKESNDLLWDSSHGPVTGTVNEPLLVMNVLNVDWVLSIGEGLHMGLNFNTLLVASISSASSLSPRASLSDLGDITGLSVLEAVGDLDPGPCFAGGSNVISDDLVLTSFPLGVFSHLLSLPLGKESSLGSFGKITGG